MSDIADEANEINEILITAALGKRKPSQAFTGHCFNCYEKIDSGHFCDSDCRLDYEKRVKLNNRG